MVKWRRKTFSEEWEWYTKLVRVVVIVLIILFLYMGLMFIPLSILDEGTVKTTTFNLGMTGVLIIVGVIPIYGFIILIKDMVEKRRSKIRVDTSLVKLSKRNQNLKLVFWVMVTIGILLLVWAIVWAIETVIKFGEVNRSISIPSTFFSGLLIIFGGIGLQEIKDIRYESALKIPKKIFKINELVELRLIGKETYIYVNNKRLFACKSLLLNIPKMGIREIKSMDEAVMLFESTEKEQYKISPEEEFIGHCSNIQVFFENGLNTDLISSNVAFPLLKALVDNKYKPALRVFKEEIAKRFNEGTYNSRMFLFLQGYLYYLTEEEKQLLKGYDLESKNILETINRLWLDDIKKGK